MRGKMLHDGITLIELLVVLLLLGLLAGVGSTGVLVLRQPASQALRDTLREARAAAIRLGAPVTLVRDSMTIRFLPDGRALGGPVDPLTGSWHDVR